MTESLSLRITEVFTSLQGEALTSGLPTTFIRLTGCPLRCVYCDLTHSIRSTIRQHATPRHVPAKIIQVSEIPRTLSGKIVELAVREVVHGRPVNNSDALANPEALANFKDLHELAH